VLGGGQEAVDAAVRGRTGRFEARFFHMIFEEEFACVRDHFGPINYIAFHPDGKRLPLFFNLKQIEHTSNYFNIYCIILAIAVVVRTVSQEFTTLTNLILILK
jgi:hypothetical protein